jgi:hypothetical protein
VGIGVAVGRGVALVAGSTIRGAADGDGDGDEPSPGDGEGSGQTLSRTDLNSWVAGAIQSEPPRPNSRSIAATPDAKPRVHVGAPLKVRLAGAGSRL